MKKGIPKRNYYIRKKIKETFAIINLNKDLSEITVSEICNNVPIARTTFYTYFQDVYELINEIENELINGFLVIYKEFKDTDFSKYKFGDSIPTLEDTLFYINANKLYFRAFLGKHPNYIFIEKWKHIIKNSFEIIWKKEKIICANQELIFEMIACSAIGAYTYWVNREKEIDLKSMSKELSGHYYYELIMKNSIIVNIEQI